MHSVARRADSEDITVNEIGARGRYSLQTAAGEAELTYRLDRRGRMVISSTYVPPPARGRAVARRLVERALADAGARGLTVEPRCAFAARIVARKTGGTPARD